MSRGVVDWLQASCLDMWSRGEFKVAFSEDQSAEPSERDAECAAKWPLKWKVHHANERCTVSSFSALHFLSIMAGRTLMLVGDSMMRELGNELKAALAPFRKQIDGYPSSRTSFRKGRVLACDAYEHSVMLCYFFAAHKDWDRNADLFSPRSGLLRGTLHPSDVVLWNAGFHHFPDDEGLARLGAFVERIASTWSAHAAQLPQLWWRETSAQHWSGGHWNGKIEPACSNLMAVSRAHANTTGVYNAITDPVIRRFRLPTLRTYSYSLPLYARHKRHECTHYCTGRFGPQALEAELLVAMLADVRPRMPPPPSDSHSGLSARWSSLMNASSLASLQARLIAQRSLMNRAQRYMASIPQQMSCRFPHGLCGLLGVRHINGAHCLWLLAAAIAIPVHIWKFRRWSTQRCNGILRLWLAVVTLGCCFAIAQLVLYDRTA